MNIADLIHKAVTGEWKLDRARTRELLELNKRYAEGRMRLYAGAEPGNRRPTANQLSTPEDYKQAYERIVLIRAARQLEEDFPFFDGILADFETFVVGDLKFRANTGNPEADQEINDFLYWQFDQCDWSERLDLTKIARMAVRTQIRDGECGFMYVDAGDTIKLSYLSADRIGNPLIATAIGPANYNGIFIDEKSGRPIRYDIWRRLPKLNAYVFQESVEPRNFIHYYNPFRFEQYHGVTDFKNTIEHGFDIKQATDFTKLNIKWRASQLPYVKNEQGRPRGGTAAGYDQPTVTNTNGTPMPLTIEADGVTQTYVKLEDQVVDYPNDFPNQQFGPLIDSLKRDCAVGVKIPLEFCYRSESGGVVQRFYVDKAMQTFKEHKRWLRRCFLDPYKNRLIQKGIDTGFLNLDRFPGLSKSLKRFGGTWQMGAAISVDYGREVDADIKLIEQGLMSQEDYVLETQGRTIQDIRREIEQHTAALFAAAKRISASTGQDIAFVLPYLSKRFPNPGAGLKAAGESVDEPTPGKSETPALVDKS